MYIYHCEIKGEPVEKLKKRLPGYIPSPTITILAHTFEEAIRKAKEYKNEDIQIVTEIISIQRRDKMDVV